jgi:Nucleotide modification associated domain 3
MRVVLSRKGFDSTSGGGPSPLLPDGRLVSLPIPERRPTPHSPRYSDVGLAPLMRSLGYRAEQTAHLDPDLVADRRERRSGWRGAFGQVGAAAGHLLNQGVGPGDLFLFFGLFRRASSDEAGGCRFVPGQKPFHAIWGYLEVDRRVDAADRAPSWALDHPHFADPGRGRPNVVFLARDGRFGVFRYRAELRLTRPGAERVTDWQVPDCLSRVALSYHPLGSTSGRLRAASRGQEFVCAADEEVASWAYGLVDASERWAA